MSRQQEFYGPMINVIELLDRVLDKGLFIDADVSLSWGGIEIVMIRARIIAAGIATFLKYAAPLGLAVSPSIPIELKVKQQ